MGQNETENRQESRSSTEDGMRQTGAGPDRLWAPWRIAYFTEPQPDECIFCTIPSDSETPDSESHIVARLADTYVILNRYPYTTGHLMVVPYAHEARFQNLAQDSVIEMMKASYLCMEVLEGEMNAQGFNIGFNLGRAAGAGIINHIHLHVVPRWDGDTNFMPVLGDTRVLPEMLEDTYNRLRPVFDRRTSEL